MRRAAAKILYNLEHIQTGLPATNPVYGSTDFQLIISRYAQLHRRT